MAVGSPLEKDFCASLFQWPLLDLVGDQEVAHGCHRLGEPKLMSNCQRSLGLGCASDRFEEYRIFTCSSDCYLGFYVSNRKEYTGSAFFVPFPFRLWLDASVPFMRGRVSRVRPSCSAAPPQAAKGRLLRLCCGVT